jgi:hypothetical protein
MSEKKQTKYPKERVLTSSGGNTDISVLKFTPKSGTMKVDDLKNQVSKYVQSKYDKPGYRSQFSIQVNYANGMTRNAAWQDFDTVKSLIDVNVDNFSEAFVSDWEPGMAYDGNASSFQVFTKYERNSGGDGDNNDCLIDCLKYVINDKSHSELQPRLKKLKKQLGLEKTDKISIDFREDIEKYFNNKIQINILMGNQCLQSTLHAQSCLTVRLENEHYTYVEKKNKNLNKFNVVLGAGGGFKSKKLAQFCYTKDTVSFRNGKGELIETMTKNEFKKLKDFKLPYCKYPKNVKDGEFEKFDADYNEVKKELDFTKYGTIALLNLTKYFNTKKNTEDFDPIGEIEEIWISNASKKAVMWDSKSTDIEHYEYDFNAYYPSLMIKMGSTWPSTEGEYLHIDKIEEALYGIYKCKIDTSHLSEMEKAFLPYSESSNHWTHHDIKIALALKCEIKMEEGTNFLKYKIRKHGNTLFKEYFKNAFELKQKYPKNVIVKAHLNMLWGALCQEENKIIITESSKTPIEIHANRRSSNIRVIDNGETTQVQLTKLNKPKFKYGEARMKPFLLALSRYDMFKTVTEAKGKPKILRMWVDSITYDRENKLLNTLLKDGCGGLKFKHKTTDDHVKQIEKERLGQIKGQATRKKNKEDKL